MYPTGCSVPKFYGLSKIHKPDSLLGPIVSSCGSVTYGVAIVLTKILKPLVGKSPHHVHSTHDFVEQANKVTLMPGECLGSYHAARIAQLVEQQTIMWQVPGSTPAPDSSRLGVDSALHPSVGRLNWVPAKT